jgi:hypothetical protein
MWHVYPLLGNNGETNNYTPAVARQRHVTATEKRYCAVRAEMLQAGQLVRNEFSQWS